MEKLDVFDSIVAPKTHLEGETSQAIYDLVGNQYGQPNPESNVFWTVYVSTAFEGLPDTDVDGEVIATLGVTTPYPNGISLIFLETTRDAHDFVGFAMSLSDYRALTTVHEVAHHFFEDEISEDDHRDDVLNIMNSNLGQIIVNGQPVSSNPPSNTIFFDPREIKTLRSKWRSP